MENIKKYLELIGHKSEDKVTGFNGVITSIAFDLYGCIQGLVNPGLDKDRKPMESRWYDIGRLKITSKNPVMDQPDFDGEKGAAEKPAVY